MSQRFLAALLLAGLVGAASAPAQQPITEWGQIYTTAHQPAARDAGDLRRQPIGVRPLDDKPADVQLARRFTDALRRAGHAVATAQAQLVLSFETEIERVPQTLQRGITDTRGRVKFQLVATLDDTRSGHRLWTGQASYLGAPNQEAPTFAQLAQLLVDEIGRTSRMRGFTLE
ncbi:MAG: hypothetical protein JNK67_22185 [Alphaproteobacteria bacterium]|nr:hypothetical protein [Alphaproteobacteria bacterium]